MPTNPAPGHSCCADLRNRAAVSWTDGEAGGVSVEQCLICGAQHVTSRLLSGTFRTAPPDPPGAP